MQAYIYIMGKIGCISKRFTEEAVLGVAFIRNVVENNELEKKKQRRRRRIKNK